MIRVGVTAVALQQAGASAGWAPVDLVLAAGLIVAAISGIGLVLVGVLGWKLSRLWQGEAHGRTDP